MNPKAVTTAQKSKEPSSKEPKMVSFRAPSVVQKQIGALQSVWGENITHVIHRAIAIAHERECRNPSR
jgi:hypothetical protein